MKVITLPDRKEIFYHNKNERKKNDTLVEFEQKNNFTKIHEDIEKNTKKKEKRNEKFINLIENEYINERPIKKQKGNVDKQCNYPINEDVQEIGNDNTIMFTNISNDDDKNEKKTIAIKSNNNNNDADDNTLVAKRLPSIQENFPNIDFNDKMKKSIFHYEDNNNTNKKEEIKKLIQESYHLNELILNYKI